MVGQIISHYRILKELGGGGMGVVYEAEDLNLKRHVALKFLLDSIPRTPEALERFTREAQSASSLNHPNICTIYEIGQHEGHPFIAMELMKGRPLNHVVAGSPLEIDQVVEYGEQIADALDAAHTEKIIHRDIKPGNIFITDRGQVKLLDFGLAKRAGKSTGDGEMPTITVQSDLTKSGSLMGTVAYMSPEQARGKDLDVRTDLYSFGAVLYEMATGTAPYGEGTAGEILESLFTRYPEAPSNLNSKVPARLEEIIAKAMEKDPNLRYQRAAEMRADLQRVKRDTSHSSMNASAVTWGPRAQRSRKFRVIGAVLALFAIALLFYFANQSKIKQQKSTTAIDKITIVVLPFADLSSNKDQEYFSDGLTEELLNELAKNPQLQVISRTSAFSFKNKKADIQTIAKKLNVTHVLEGSVRKSGEQLRITAQLIETATDTQLWSQTYDRSFSNIFAIQEDIAASVAGALHITLTTGSAPGQRETTDEAYNAYLEGTYFHARYGEENLKKAVEKLEKALGLDPNYAKAWIGLAWAHIAQADSGLIPLDEGYAKASAEVQKGLKLDPNLSFGYAALGWIKSAYDWDWAGAEAAYKRALELEPGQASVNANAATFFATLGRFDEALRLDRIAMRLDPLRTPIFNNHGNHAFRAGLYEEAKQALLKALELDPQYTGARTFLARIYLEQSKIDDALRVIELEPDEFWRSYGFALAYHAAGRSKEADDTLARIVRERQHDAAFQIAQIYAYRAEVDAAFDWLERAYKQRDGGLVEIIGDPLLKNLRTDPRWAAFLLKLKLPVL